MDKQIFSGEWKIMECLWEKSPQTLMELVRSLGQSTGWAKSTVTTMVTRMEAKGLLFFETGGRAKKIYPALTRQEATAAETDSLLHKVFHGSAGLLMTTLVQENRLTDAECQELYALLKKGEEEACHD